MINDTLDRLKTHSATEQDLMAIRTEIATLEEEEDRQERGLCRIREELKQLRWLHRTVASLIAIPCPAVTKPESKPATIQLLRTGEPIRFSKSVKLKVIQIAQLMVSYPQGISATKIQEITEISYPTIRKYLMQNPDYFLEHPDKFYSLWTLKDAGKEALLNPASELSRKGA